MIVGALRDAGLQAEAGDDHFETNAEDAVWLPEIGKRGWILLTKDKAIRTNQLERDALLKNNVAAFMLGRGNVPGAEMARIFISAMRSIQRVVRRYEVPVIASVAVSAKVTVLWADGAWLKPPKVVK